MFRATAVLFSISSEANYNFDRFGVVGWKRKVRGKFSRADVAADGLTTSSGRVLVDIAFNEPFVGSPVNYDRRLTDALGPRRIGPDLTRPGINYRAQCIHLVFPPRTHTTAETRYSAVYDNNNKMYTLLLWLLRDARPATMLGPRSTGIILNAFITSLFVVFASSLYDFS